MKWLISALLCFSSLSFFAQKENKWDRVTTKDGAFWEGRIIEDIKNDRITIQTRDSTFHQISYQNIQTVKYGSKSQALPEDSAHANVKKEGSLNRRVSKRDRKPDYIITKRGEVLEGKIVEEVKGAYVKLAISDTLVKTIEYKDIRNIKYGVDPSAALPQDDIYYADRDNPDNRANRNSTFLERHRRTGMGLTTAIGLTVGGLGLILAGIIMIAANPSNVTTYSTSTSAGVHFSNVAAVGIAFDIIGLPLFIVGAVKWAKANRRMSAASSPDGQHPVQLN